MKEYNDDSSCGMSILRSLGSDFDDFISGGRVRSRGIAACAPSKAPFCSRRAPNLLPGPGRQKDKSKAEV